MIFIIGGEGYVGSAYPRLFQHLGLEHQVITRANYADFVGQRCDVLINANGNSKKFMADRDPKWEFDASVRSVLHSLEDIKSDCYIHLSTGDVYPETHSPEVSLESQDIDSRRQSRYGLHKHMAEHLVRSLHPRWIVMRMGGFVGPGMLKNAVFDMLNAQPVWLTPDSELQFISTDTAARLVWRLYENGVGQETVNLGARGVVRIGDLHARLQTGSPFADQARRIRFEISTDKLARLTGVSLPSSADEVEAFFLTEGR
ncbi:NAD-dependent epimerase/dehydratase family protein [Caulobacter sp. LjRoot300]|uniref:NAD-dependent epimerase/dehydratase family protein n=1 Tax=Caulobacter sp. LjRoot300 TaxID=3342321 RepID=UPI003ECD9F65